MTIEEQIWDKAAQGVSLRNIAKELNIAFHTVRNTIYKKKKKKLDRKIEISDVSDVSDTGVSGAKAIIMRAKKINKELKKDSQKYKSNGKIKNGLKDIKDIANFYQVADQVKRIEDADERIGKLQNLINIVESRISAGIFLKEDEVDTFFVLLRLYKTASDETKNNSLAITETLKSIAGAKQAGLGDDVQKDDGSGKNTIPANKCLEYLNIKSYV